MSEVAKNGGGELSEAEELAEKVAIAKKAHRGSNGRCT